MCDRLTHWTYMNYGLRIKKFMFGSFLEKLWLYDCNALVTAYLGLGSHFTCIWSPVKTTCVLGPAKASGVNASGSKA